MIGLPKKVEEAFQGLKGRYTHIYLKSINQNYYVYKQTFEWQPDTKKSKTISEYIGRITLDGNFIKRLTSYKDELAKAQALIASRGGEITWNKNKESEEHAQSYPKHDIRVKDTDLKVLMALSMNARMSIHKLAEFADLNEQTAYSRVKTLENKFGIQYISEINAEAMGFTTYLIFIKFENTPPSADNLAKAFQAEPKVQLAAIVKGDYDAIAYLLDENSEKAEDTLWKIMSETQLSSYNAKWYMVPLGQVYSFIPLREEFIDKVIGQQQWHRTKSAMTQTKKSVMKREFILLKEMNKDSSVDFSEIDNDYGLGRGASRYTYQRLLEEGTIIRPTITMNTIPLRYIGILLVETLNPKKVSETRANLLSGELEYGPLINKYSFIGNASMPEGSILVLPVVKEGEMEEATKALMSNVKGISVRTLIISKILVGSFCYRRFDNAYSRQYNSLIRLGKISSTKPTAYS